MADFNYTNSSQHAAAELPDKGLDPNVLKTIVVQSFCSPPKSLFSATFHNYLKTKERPAAGMSQM